MNDADTLFSFETKMRVEKMYMMENRESVSSKLISYAHLSNMYHFQ